MLAFLLIACGGSHPDTGQGPTSRPTASTAPPTPVASATPSPNTAQSPNADLPVTKVDFSCRLPVVTMVNRTGGDAGITFQGGFITLPAAQLTDDPAGTMRSRYPEEGFATTAAPVLIGSGGYPFYDRAQSRWVPVPPSQAEADGRTYSYVLTALGTSLSKAYVVNVASGGAQAFDLPTPERPSVADYSASGVYLLSQSAIGGPSQGVWLLNPATGNVTQLRNLGWVWAVRDGYAWVGRFDSQDKTVWPPMEIAPLNSLVRIDLATGAETTWFYQAGRYPWMMGLASRGRPVVAVGGPDGQEVRVITQPGSPGDAVYTDRGGGFFNVVEGDGDRIWVGSATGIYLYRPDRGFQKVFSYSVDPSTFTCAPCRSQSVIEPAGFCS